MIIENAISDTTLKLTNLLSKMHQQPHVETVVLSTADGLTVNGLASDLGHISAIGGFLLSAAHLSSNILGRKNCQEVFVHLNDDSFLVCWPFMAGESQLILTVLFNQRFDYRRLMVQKIKEIQLAMED